MAGLWKVGMEPLLAISCSVHILDKVLLKLLSVCCLAPLFWQMGGSEILEQIFIHLCVYLNLLLQRREI